MLLGPIDDQALEIDLFPRFWWRGITWLDEQKVIETAVQHREFIWRPAEEFEFFVALNHSYLHGGFYPRKYHRRLVYLLDRAEREITPLMQALYGKADTSEILRLIRENEIDQLDLMNRRVRIRCLIRYLYRRPLQLICGFISSYAYDYWLKAFPPKTCSCLGK